MARRTRYVHRETGNYLQLSTGEPTLNILRLARPGLREKLELALSTASHRREQVTLEGLKVNSHRTTLALARCSTSRVGHWTPPLTKGMLRPFGNPASGSPQQAEGHRK